MEPTLLHVKYHDRIIQPKKQIGLNEEVFPMLWQARLVDSSGYAYTRRPGMPSVDGPRTSASRTRPRGIRVHPPKGDVQANGAAVRIHGRYLDNRKSGSPSTGPCL